MSHSPINKKELAHLAELARLKLSAHEEERLLEDLQNIVGYIAELQKIPTENVVPMSGSTLLQNSFREDNERENTNREAGVDQFPEAQDGYLKVPPVFEKESRI